MRTGESQKQQQQKSKNGGWGGPNKKTRKEKKDAYLSILRTGSIDTLLANMRTSRGTEERKKVAAMIKVY